MKDVWKSARTDPPKESGEYIGAIYDREKNETYTTGLYYASANRTWWHSSCLIEEPLIVYEWMPMPKAPVAYTIGRKKEDVD